MGCGGTKEKKKGENKFDARWYDACAVIFLLNFILKKARGAVLLEWFLNLLFFVLKSVFIVIIIAIC